MKGYVKAMKELRSVLPTASPLQLAIALEAVAFLHVEMYMAQNPPPAGITPEERDELHNAMIYSSITTALNTAAEVALDLSVKPQPMTAFEQAVTREDEERAKAAADAAIAKAAGKLH